MNQVNYSEEFIDAIADIREEGNYNMVMDASSVVNELIDLGFHKDVSQMIVSSTGRVDFEKYMIALKQTNNIKTLAQ